jgi:L-malate glycosyltransferase
VSEIEDPLALGQQSAEATFKPVRVLIVAPASPLVGGQAVQAARLIERLNQDDDVSPRLQPINPQVKGIFRGLQKVKYLRTVVTSIRYIFELAKNLPSIDVVHVFSAGETGFLIATTPAVLVAKVFGKKTILNYRHGGAAEHLKNWRRTALPTVRMFDRIVVPSGFLVDTFAKFNLRAESISNFVDSEAFKFRGRDPLRPIFLSNRNFDELYNIACTLRAFQLIQRQVPDSRLIVAGDGEKRISLEHLASELGLSNIEFRGRVPQSKMADLYDEADIYLNSPNVDNMPGSVIEAMSCGLPVVSTNAGGIPYIVENGMTGLLVKVNDHEALAGQALRLLGDRALANKITSAARAECVKYSWEQVRAHWFRLYRELGAE